MDGTGPGRARAELGEFLRVRRESIAPEQVDLPRGRGRRTPGLRREEVALLAGVSVTWYTWLEQGRRIKASDDVLRAIGRALRLDDVGTDHLLTLARPVADVPAPLPARRRAVRAAPSDRRLRAGSRLRARAALPVRRLERRRGPPVPAAGRPRRARAQPALGAVHPPRRARPDRRLGPPRASGPGRVPRRDHRRPPRPGADRAGRPPDRRRATSSAAGGRSTTSPASRPGCAASTTPSPAG